MAIFALLKKWAKETGMTILLLCTSGLAGFITGFFDTWACIMNASDAHASLFFGGLLIVISMGLGVAIWRSVKEKRQKDRDDRIASFVNSFQYMLEDLVANSGMLDKDGHVDMSGSYTKTAKYLEAVKRIRNRYLKSDVIDAVKDISNAPMTMQDNSKAFKKLGEA